MSTQLSSRSLIARARTDGDDRLIEADEPLAGLHQRCGGEDGGTLAVPQLLALVQKARSYGIPLARSIAANDGDERIRAWVEAVPLGVKGADGCEIGLGSWQTSPLIAEDEGEGAARRIEVARAAAEFTARLDSRQSVLTAVSNAADLEGLASDMQQKIGEHWTNFVEFPGSNHQQPLHWRLLDGADCVVAGSRRDWRAVLAPLGQPEPGSAGFELFLISDQPLAKQSAAAPSAMPMDNTPSLGKELSPVLRQPVARIIANAETIRTRLAGPLADEYSDYAADIASAGQHLLALIDDLADLEVVESERFQVAPDKIDLADVAERATGILGVRAQEKQIDLVNPGKGEAMPAIGEFRRVLQVLLNLIGNAIRYAPSGSTIQLSLSELGGMAAITVADEGPGLSEDQQQAIFGKFERLGRNGDGGSGLGLYISRKLANAMDGELSVESTLGEGARFTLALPRPD